MFKKRNTAKCAMQDKQYWKYVGISSSQLLAGSIVLPVLAPYFSSLGYSDSWISIVFGIFPFVMFLTSIFSGELADQIGRSWLIKGCLFTTAGSYLLYFFGSSWSIISARVLDGISYAALIILLLAKIQDMLDDAHRGKYTGIFFTIKDGVRILGPILGGYLADKWIGIPFISAVVILLASTLLLRSAKFHRKKESAIHPFKDLKWFITHKQLLPFVILGPLMNGLLPVVTVFLPLLIVNNLGMSYAAAGAASSAYMAGHLAQFFFGDLSDRIGPVKLIIAGTLTMSLAVILTPFLGVNYVALLSIFVIYGAGAAAWNVSANQWLSTLGERENKEGVVLGSYISIAKLGEGTAYLVSAVIVASFGYTGVFLLLGVLGLVGVVAAGHLFGHLRRNDSLL